MRLSEVLAGVGTEPTTAKAKVEVTGVCADSRTVKAGDVFFAVPGTKADGAQFARDAAGRGAVAVVAEKDVPGLTVPLFRVANAKQALALAAGNFYGNPAREVALLGVTGTNGKTTTAWLLESICAAGGASVGLFGTIEVRWPGVRRADQRRLSVAVTRRVVSGFKRAATAVCPAVAAMS